MGGPTFNRSRNRPDRLRRRFSPIEALEHRLLLSASLVKDISTVTRLEGQLPNELFAAGNILYFADGYTLWRSDGSDAGTFSLPASIARIYGYDTFADVGGSLFFAGRVPGYEYDGLWKSDGTVAGTVQVRGGDINSDPVYPVNLANVNGTLFFAGRTVGAGYELWKSDGTASGTTLVRDIAAGDAWSDPQALTNVNGTLYFRAKNAAHGSELWKSDGTETGTVMVKDIRPGPESSGPLSLTNVNGTLMFTADDGAGGLELWKSDGTDAGTVRVRDLRHGATGSGPTLLTAVGSTLYFTANDGVRGYELWKSDGTEAGTALVKEVIPGTTGSGLAYLTASGGRLFFTVNDFRAGNELWTSDGTADGTHIVRNLAFGYAGSIPTRLTDFNGTLFFVANDYDHGVEWWKTDGTEAGTVLLKDIAPAGGWSGTETYVNTAAVVNDTLFFSATTDGIDHSLWKSDGSDTGTVAIKKIRPTFRALTSMPSSFVEFNGVAYFSADDTEHGRELWKSDGTEQGTALVKEFTPSWFGSSITVMGAAAGSLFIRAGTTLYRSDGTTDGTVPFANSPTIFGWTRWRPHGGKMFFTAEDPVHGDELWVSDGTDAGTHLLKDVNPGSANGRVGGLTTVGGLLYFTANDGVHGDELWVSDGTEAGTVMVKDIRPGKASGGPWLMTDVSGTLFFRAGDAATGYELWTSDGTPQGTVMVRDIRPGPANSGLDHFTAVDGRLFFTANDGISGHELWSSDGTAAGTALVADVMPGPRSSVPTYLTAAHGRLFFRGNDGATGYELWESDGTPAGTRRVVDLLPGSASSMAAPFRLGNILYFYDASFRIWQTDGTAGGTSLASGAASPAHPNPPVKIGDTVLFTGYQEAYGWELWKFTPDASPAARRAPEQPASAPPPVVLAELTPPGNTGQLGPMEVPRGSLGPGAASAPPPASAPAPARAASRASAEDSGTSPVFYDAFNSWGGPDRAAFGLAGSIVAYYGSIFPGDTNQIDEGMARAMARGPSDANVPLIIDLEEFPTDLRGWVDGQLQIYLERMIQIVEWVHDERPDVRVGYFGAVPVADYWTAVTGGPQALADWREANERLRPLADVVDLIAPAIYTVDEERYMWRWFAEANLREAAIYGKPVAPFLMTVYDPNSRPVAMQQIPADFWQMQLEVARSLSDLAFIWGGVGNYGAAWWSDDWPWWAVTRSMIDVSAAPRVTITPVSPDPHAGAVATVSITFSEPVTGFDLSDLALTRDGGDNLLASHATLSSADAASYVLSGLSLLTGTPGQYVLTLSSGASGIVDEGGNLLTAGARDEFIVVLPPNPTVQSAVVDGGDAQRSAVRGITVTFDREVMVQPDAFRLTRRDGAAGAAPLVAASNPSGDGRRYLLAFSGPEVTAAGGSIPDGVWDLTVLAASVRAATGGGGPGGGGANMAADFVFRFHRLAGDGNGDAVVNVSDLGILSTNYGRASGPSAAGGDFNGDGIVDVLDLGLLASNYGKRVVALAGLQTAPASPPAAAPAMAPTAPGQAKSGSPATPSAPRQPVRKVPRERRMPKRPAAALASTAGALPGQHDRVVSAHESASAIQRWRQCSPSPLYSGERAGVRGGSRLDIGRWKLDVRLRHKSRMPNVERPTSNV